MWSFITVTVSEDVDPRAILGKFMLITNTNVESKNENSRKDFEV
jgi:hypothetical protein